MSTTLTYSKISRIEFEFTRDSSDPTYSFLQLRLHSALSTQNHIIYIFPSNATTAVDHLHNIFLSTTVLVSPEPDEPVESEEQPCMKDHRSIGIQAASLDASYEFYFGKRDRPMQTTPARAFHNALRILRSLDYHEVSFIGDESWDDFRKNPYEFFITTSDINAARIWDAIQKRHPFELREGKATQKGESNG